MTADASLNTLTIRHIEYRRAERALYEQVFRARRAGATWEAVGKALGVTREAAWARFEKRLRNR